MKFADAKNDAERFELLWRAVFHYLPEADEDGDPAWFESLKALAEEIEATGYQGIPLPGDIDPDGKEITRSALEALIEEAAAKWRAENRLEHRVRDLVADAVEARNAAALKIRETFHKRWGSYWKCGRCGGPLAPGHAVASELGAKQCPHGDHEIVLVHNGYSWTTRPPELLELEPGDRVRSRVTKRVGTVIGPCDFSMPENVRVLFDGETEPSTPALKHLEREEARS